jgi:hypothetical protein
VFGEQSFYIFEGALKDNAVIYSDFAPLGIDKLRENSIDLALKDGNRLELGRDSVCVYKNQKKVWDNKKAHGTFLIQFR